LFQAVHQAALRDLLEGYLQSVYAWVDDILVALAKALRSALHQLRCAAAPAKFKTTFLMNFVGYLLIGFRRGTLRSFVFLCKNTSSGVFPKSSGSVQQE
jgi:hypothetical protein